ncbi:MAG: phospho-sugar mutase [Bacilli bacterium]|nr:phospho-sugar mutase [Bacilli bacterium]
MSIVEENYQRWLNSEKVPADQKDVLRKMSGEQKDDSFFKEIEFGTGGMRGVLGPGTNRINEFTIKKVTVAFGQSLIDLSREARARGVVISHDNRHFSREYSELAAKVLNKMGINAYLFDSLRPTPELSYAVRYMHAIGGIMITASHNPKEYNGYKVYDEKGCQLTPEKIQPMLDILASLPDELTVEPPVYSVEGVTKPLGPEVDDDYVKEVEATQINPDLNKKGFKIVYTPNHGTSLENALRVFKDCGYEIYPVECQCTHDPDFSGTLSPNPEVAEAYIEPIKLAKQIGAQLIVMTDPDGDRCGLAYLSSKGTYERLTGNESAALLIDYLLSERKRLGTLSDNGVIYDTIVSSDLGRKVAANYGVKAESFLTGFKFIGDRIAYYEDRGNGHKFEFGYEESYGCLVAPFVRDKDGIQAILLYSEMALWYHLKGITLDVAIDNLQKRFGYHYDIQKALKFEGSAGFGRMMKLMEDLHTNPPKEILGLKVVRVEDYIKLEAVNADGSKEKLVLPKSEVVKLFLEDGSWIAVRPSGTEPKCKFYVEVVSKAQEGLDKKADDLAESLKKSLGL